MIRLCLVLMLGCAATPPVSARDTQVVVFAAASLKNALDDAVLLYSEDTETEVLVSYAGTGTLARQIEQGAPADLFLSADRDWMAYLETRGLIRPETSRTVAANRLVLIAPAEAELAVDLQPGLDLRPHLGGDGRLAIADTEAVPAGRYAKAALESLGAWEGVTDRLVATDNVRTALAFVARGETPLGIVYETDVAAEPAVQVVGLFPETSHPPIRYRAAVTAASTSDEAGRFLDFLAGDTAWPAFERQGFLKASPES